MGAKTRRLEARVDEETMRTLASAAEVLGESVSAFVVGAAMDQANLVLSRADRTLMPADQFASLVAALDRAPEPIPELARHAGRETPFERG
ncbi:MAG: DUF1778 domain-containing protein [Bifidobacteriaceae bacterium]|jgi:uncharacterized protein (DUF1778 family)|nr:DUF1778 domain-containing protein [Bifidobacteriaceae bacterium]